MKFLFALLVLVTSTVFAQDEPMVEIEGPEGQKVMVPASQADAIRQQMAEQMGRQGKGPKGPKPAGGPPGGAPEKPADKPAEGAASDVTQRATEPPSPPDPKELEVRPDDDGKLAFSFRNQPWPELMEWLADVSQLPLDWQELPSGFVNIASPGRYTVAETRDLFNRHLLSRGFTMLELDGGLTVVKTEGINPAVVPRVHSSQLDDLQPHTFVKTSLDCGWLIAAKLAEELKPLISGNGKLVALEQTNRLEAMDAAINLQQIFSLLNEEQSAQARGDLAREFELRYIPAEEAKEMLSAFLGIEEEKPAAAMSPQQMRQMQMMQQQMMQQNGGNPMPQAGNQKKEVSIVVNPRRNSLLVNAPPDRLAIAAQFIMQVDVPGQTLQSLADVESRVEVLRMASLDPARLAEIVGDMNILEPSTRLRVDEKNKALIISGSAADRFIVKSLAERLDGSARRFEVLQLRRLDARQVAESIQFLMGVNENDDSQRSRRMMYYGFFGGDEQETDKDKFRVAANVRYRQVLLWANESEMQEVRSLLMKLGELPPEGGSRRTTRMIEASASPETLEYLRQLRARFQQMSPNEIILPSEDQFAPLSLPSEDTDEDDSNDQQGTGDDAPPAESPPDRNAVDPDAVTTDSDTVEEVEIYQLVNNQVAEPQTPATEPRAPIDERTVPEDKNQPTPRVESGADFDRLFGQDSAAPADPQVKKTGAPIRIDLDDEGNLIISSDDTRALDQLENMMLELAPPKRPYTVFHVKYATASWTRLNLLDYFEEQKEEDNQFPWFIFGMDSQEEETPEGLGRGSELKFVADNDTGTIVVSGATSAELKTIAELIQLWDVPEPVDKRSARYTRLVTLQFSRAEKVAETIKDAYRDLLSSNDKAFNGGGQQGGGGRGAPGGGAANEPRNRDSGGSSLVNTEGGRESSQSDFSFKGKLSIGIDQVGNTLLVSAEGQDLLELICDVIEQVDRAAQPQGAMQIYDLPGTVNPQALETALRFLNPNQEAAPSQSPVITPNARTNSRGNARANGRDNGALPQPTSLPRADE